MLVASLIALCAGVSEAAPPDLTAGEAATTSNQINLGPTGMVGWMYHEANPQALLTDWNYTGQSRQILVKIVDVGSPADSAGILAGDVILGASGDGSAPGDFTADARKSLALAIAAAEARSTPELKLKVWRGGSTSTYSLTLQHLGAYGPDAPLNDAKSALIAENARQSLLAQDAPGSYNLGTLALIALDDPAHPDHLAMKTRIDAEIAAMLPDAAELALMNSGIAETESKIGWKRGHQLIVLAEYYLNYGEHPSGGVFQAIQAHVNSITTGQSIYGTFNHNYAVFHWPDDPNTNMISGYGAVNSASVPGLYGLLLARECGVASAALDTGIQQGVDFYASYAGQGAIPYGEHEVGTNEFSSNGKSGAAALLFDLAAGRSEQSQYYAKMSAAAFNEFETGHTGCYFQNWWSPLGAAHGGDDAIKSYFAETGWMYDLARRWDGSFDYNHIYTTYDYSNFNGTAAYILTYALPLKRLHMTGRNRSASGVLDPTQRAQAVASAHYDETTRTKEQLIADLQDWSTVVHLRAANALAGMSLSAADIDSLHTLASDPAGTSRAGALTALEKIADPASAPVLAAILSDEDPNLRRLAAKALLKNPAKNGELDVVLAAAAAAQRDAFPVAPRDPLQLDLKEMGNILFGSTGILYDATNGSDLRGVDRQLLYPAIRAIANCPSGLGRSTLRNASRGLDLADVEALGDTILDMVYYRAPADAMFADGAQLGALDALTKYNFAEVVPASGRAIRADTDQPDRATYGAMFKSLEQFAATSSRIEPDPRITELCIEFIANYSTGVIVNSNVPKAQDALAAILTDQDPSAPKYFKSFDWVVTDAVELTLPSNRTQLHASVTDLAKGQLTYTWRKVYGPGEVSFSVNGMQSSKDTTVTFTDAQPGHYLFEVAVIDARGFSEITGTVAMTLYDSSGLLPANAAPTADSQSLTVAPFTASPITLSGSDPEAMPLVYQIVQPPRHGVLSGQAPNLTYTSNYKYHSGSDRFTFQVVDSFGQSSEATVSITVDASTLQTYVHESFNYPFNTGLAGNSGGTGMTGSWLDGPDAGLAWIYDESTATTPISNPMTSDTLSWDGVVNNLPPTAASGAKFLGLSADVPGDRWEVHRALAQDAGTMAGADKVLWASAIFRRTGSGWGEHLGFALSTDCFKNATAELDTSGNHGSGEGNGLGVARNIADRNTYSAVAYSAGTPVSRNSAPYSVGDYVFVLKYEFGATDKVSVYAFYEDDVIDETLFNDRAATATATIDESTLNRLTLSSVRGNTSIDEVRIGDSFAAVVGLADSIEDVAAPAPDPMTFDSAPALTEETLIIMTATTASDPNGVQYYFTCTSGNGNDSGWQDSPTYTDAVAAGSTYSYSVMARDKSSNFNRTAPSAPESVTIPGTTTLTPGQISWSVHDISGNITDVSTLGALVQAHSGADLGTRDVVDGSTFDINGVMFDDDHVFDSPDRFDTISGRAGSYTPENADYYTLLQYADRNLSGQATFTFSGLTIGSTYQIQVWRADNGNTAGENGMVLNSGGTNTIPTPGTLGHATLLREVSEGGYGQYAVGTFVADASTLQFLAQAYGGLTTTPSAQSNLTINASQLRQIATAPDSIPPTLNSAGIVDHQAGADVWPGTTVIYTLTFSEAMDPASVTFADFANAGTASVTVGSVTQIAADTFDLRITPVTAGTLILQVKAGAVLTDLVGNALDTTSPIVDEITITVLDIYDSWSGSGTYANPFVDTLPTSDPDNDGRVNLMEFAYGTDPTVAGEARLAIDGSAHGSPVLGMSDGGDTLYVYFVRRDDHEAPGSVSYMAQFSSDMRMFYDSAVAPTVVTDSSADTDYEVVKVPFPATLPDGQPARFARIAMTQVE